MRWKTRIGASLQIRVSHYKFPFAAPSSEHDCLHEIARVLGRHGSTGEFIQGLWSEIYGLRFSWRRAVMAGMAG